jgi:hypothetical protein
MRRLLPALLTAIALLALPGVAAAVQPTATNGPASNVTLTTATLNGVVSTDASVSVHFEWGTDQNLSGSTATDIQNFSAGASQPVTASISPLTPGVTYFFQLIANNGGGDVAATPISSFVASQKQDVFTGAFSNLTSSSAHVAGTVTPNGLATQSRFRYGTSTGSQQFTPVVMNGAGTTPVAMEADLAGLPAFTRIYYTLRTDRSATVANAVEGTQQSFVTDRKLTSISANGSRVKYNGTSTISGTVSGAGASGVNLVVQAQKYPFSGPYTTVLTGKTASNGSYRLKLSKLLHKTHIVVSTTGSSVVTSRAATINVEPSVGLTTKKKGSKRVFSGSIHPKLGSGARAKVQRKSGKRWITIRTLKLTSTSSASSRYKTTLSKRKKATYYRVQVSSGSSDLATGVSRTRKVK